MLKNVRALIGLSVGGAVVLGTSGLTLACAMPALETSELKAAPAALAPAAPAREWAPLPRSSPAIVLPGSGSLRVSASASAGPSGSTISVPLTARAGAENAANEAALREAADRAELADLLNRNTTTDSRVLYRAFNNHLTLEEFRVLFPREPYFMHYNEAAPRLPETSLEDPTSAANRPRVR